MESTRTPTGPTEHGNPSGLDLWNHLNYRCFKHGWQQAPAVTCQQPGALQGDQAAETSEGGKNVWSDCGGTECCRAWELGAGSDCGELQKPCPEKELCQRMPQPMIMDSPEGTESPDELEVDEPSREEGAGKGDVQEGRQATDSKRLETMQVDRPVSEGTVPGGGTIGTVLLNDIADVQQASRFPSLRTTTSVSWCFLNYTKPNDALTASLASVYASWCVSSYNPNPPSLSTKSALGLLCSKQKKNTETYAMASMCPPGMGKVVSSYLWKQKPEQEKPELMQLDMIKSEKKPRGISCRDRVKEDHKEKEVSSKQAEPTRIKIFEGGYKSNEDYVYVRGRGRGKYICEECGIRCKKPSMLKKHIRSHTDVRPYVCKFCNFAFKTKGNLTKHMKSKAHTKKCLELGVPVTSVDDVEAEETDYDQRDSGKTGVSGMVSEHQFSDADDSEGAEEDGDEIEEEDDDDDEYEGDSTPKTCSRSASPRPDGISSLSSSRDPASELSGPTPKHPLFSYFLNPPSIQITQLAGESLGSEDQSPARTAPSGEGYGKNLDVPSSMEEDSFGGLSPEHGSASPVCGSSPARETSPTSRRYLSPRRDLSPRGRLSPRREASPLRHISPKRRDLSPRGHLAAISPTRPLSPGRDIPGRRELSPRSRHRGMMRAASPRRGLHHHLHSAPWDLGQYLLPEAGLSGQEKRKNSAQSLWLPGEMTGSPDPPTVAQQGLFSHLPLHSQRQVRTPLPMIPIGGIQVVHSTAGPAYPARLPLQRNPLEGPSPDHASLQLLEGMANAAGEKGAPGSQEKLPSSPGP
ncbi:hypothetical protein AGOR_G00109960 [Albula goreensis]|uniref:C2H2-type domain-containing protein n=1 Tax=Albula goreensis TaxID=1534307 RepID=A0A8T3DIT9_9TELE|nr:hypothetical protein AGOR_G00109960 [Albula goreensis]